MSNQPKRPELPAHIRRLDRNFRKFDRALASGNGEGMIESGIGLLGYLTTGRTDAELAEESRYEQERLAWNAWVEKERASVRGAAHDKEMAKVRAAACSVCFATHAGEC